MPSLASATSKRMSIVVYSIAALSVVGATLVAAFLADTGRGKQAPSQAPSAVKNATGMPTSTIDLSSMTPRQAADRLFNRVMSASERNDTQEATRFAPMAVAAYGRVTNLDADAHYHLGLLYLLLDDLEQTRIQAGLLKEKVPQHLLALLLENDVASRTDYSATASRATADFIMAYDAEMATARPEYDAHKTTIERFRVAADATDTVPVVASLPAAVEGASLFELRCAECHGREAAGTNRGPPLVHRIYEPGHHADQSFYRAVREGVRSHHWEFGDMAPIAGVTDQEISSIVAYVRGRQKTNGIE